MENWVKHELKIIVNCTENAARLPKKAFFVGAGWEQETKRKQAIAKALLKKKKGRGYFYGTVEQLQARYVRKTDHDQPAKKDWGDFYQGGKAYWYLYVSQHRKAKKCAILWQPLEI